MPTDIYTLHRRYREQISSESDPTLHQDFLVFKKLGWFRSFEKQHEKLIRKIYPRGKNMRARMFAIIRIEKWNTAP